MILTRLVYLFKFTPVFYKNIFARLIKETNE